MEVEQHPVPQHIASFQFKLFGSLTARQFISLAIPMTIAGFIFFSALEPFIIKYILAGIIGGAGAFVALVPVGGRPFDKWLVSFIKAVFAPTQRIWIKEKQIPEFLFVVTRPPRDDKIPEEFTEKSRERLFAYLKSLPNDNQSPLDTREAMAISHIDFGKDNAPAVNTAPILWPSDIEIKKSETVVPKAETAGAGLDTLGSVGDETVEKPAGILQFKEGVKSRGQAATRDKQKPEKRKEIPVAYINTPKIQQGAKVFSVHGFEERLQASHGTQEHEVPKPKLEKMHIFKKPRLQAHLASDGNFEVDNIISVMAPDNRIRFVRGVGKTRVRKLHFAPPANFDLSKLPIRGERRFEISEELKRRFKFEDDSPQVVLPNEKNTTDTLVSFRPAAGGRTISQVLPKVSKMATVGSKTREKVAVPVVAAPKVTTGAESAHFAVTDTRQETEFQEANSRPNIIPLTDKPNVLSGLVTDSNGVPIEGAVLVIRDSGGIPVRALKANKLGQFLSATPLADGQYTIEVESDAATFKAASINLSGQILQPLGLRAEGGAN